MFNMQKTTGICKTSVLFASFQELFSSRNETFEEQKNSPGKGPEGGKIDDRLNGYMFKVKQSTYVLVKRKQESHSFDCPV
jgi:hypothetical protein